MGNRRWYLGIAVVLSVTACMNNDELADENSSAPGFTASPPAQGRAVYDSLCASCHREGVNGAPVTGDPSAWSDRSSLWMAVLSEHVMSGYLQMPARGGDETLSDADIEEATEYMLLQAFPNRPDD